MNNLVRIIIIGFLFLSINYEQGFSQAKKVAKESNIPKKHFKNWLESNINIFLKNNKNVDGISFIKTFNNEGLVSKEIKINSDSSVISTIENYEFTIFDSKINKLPKEGNGFLDLLKEFDEMPNQKYGLKISIINYCSEPQVASLEKELSSEISEAEINIGNDKEIRKYFFNRGTLIGKHVLQFTSKGKNFKSRVTETSFEFIFKNGKLEKNITNTNITYLNPNKNIIDKLSD